MKMNLDPHIYINLANSVMKEPWIKFKYFSYSFLSVKKRTTGYMLYYACFAPKISFIKSFKNKVEGGKEDS